MGSDFLSSIIFCGILGFLVYTLLKRFKGAVGLEVKLFPHQFALQYEPLKKLIGIENSKGVSDWKELSAADKKRLGKFERSAGVFPTYNLTYLYADEALSVKKSVYTPDEKLKESSHLYSLNSFEIVLDVINFGETEEKERIEFVLARFSRDPQGRSRSPVIIGYISKRKRYKEGSTKVLFTFPEALIAKGWPRFFKKKKLAKFGLKEECYDSGSFQDDFGNNRYWAVTEYKTRGAVFSQRVDF